LFLFCNKEEKREKKKEQIGKADIAHFALLPIEPCLLNHAHYTMILNGAGLLAGCLFVARIEMGCRDGWSSDVRGHVDGGRACARGRSEYGKWGQRR
jgi:hypothetical protein